jgi:hypothetical protein
MIADILCPSLYARQISWVDDENINGWDHQLRLSPMRRRCYQKRSTRVVHCKSARCALRSNGKKFPKFPLWTIPTMMLLQSCRRVEALCWPCPWPVPAFGSSRFALVRLCGGIPTGMAPAPLAQQWRQWMLGYWEMKLCTHWRAKTNTASG